MNTFLQQCWWVLGEFSPWLLLGLLIAGLLHVLLPPNFVRRHLGGRGFASVLKAALFGVPLPLCSCGVIPATIGLKRDGASDGAAVGFLISTPQTGVDSIAVSAAFLGWPFAVFKVVAAFVTGVLGGWLTDVTGPATPALAAVPVAAPRPRRTVAATMREFFEFTFGELLAGIWRWVAIGIVISAIITTVFPENSLAQAAWAHGPAGMLIMLLIALPMYVCATGSVPIAASLVAAGLPPGAALVFLMAGPASNAATIGAVYKTFGKRVTAIYLGVIVAASLLLGYGFDFVLGGDSYRTASVHCHSPAAGAGLGLHLWAGLLLLILASYPAHALWRRCFRRPAAQPAVCPACAGDSGAADAAAAGGPITLHIEGMNCQHCVGSVHAALAASPGVTHVKIDLAAGTATIVGANLVLADLEARVAKAGFRATA